MASARSQVRTGGAPNPRVRPAIRWDRVWPLVLCAVAVLVVALYIGPTLNYFQTAGEADQRAAQLHQQQQEHKALQARARELRRPNAVEREARRTGMIRPDEKPFAIKR